MLQNDIKMAVRNFGKQRVFFFINLFGLVIGFTCFLLIALYLFDELTYDAFHKNADRIYRVVETRTSAGGKQSKLVAVAANIAGRGRRELTGVADATRFSMLGRSNIANPENAAVFYESYFVADASFFNIFNFPVIAGNPATALTEPYSVVLNQEMAVKLFGHTAVVGKTIRKDKDDLPYTITAVVSVPENSHIRFNVLFSEATFYGSKPFMDFLNNDWNSNTFVTYFLLKNKDAQPVATAIENLVSANNKDVGAGISRFRLQPLKEIHFHSAGMEGNMDKPGNITHMYVFGLIALFVLLIACINYMNLTTARFAGRSREIGVRKVAGASRQNLMKQFLTEASLLTVIALVISLGVVKLLLPRFNAFTEKQLALDGNTDYRIWLGILLTVILTGLVAGLYPAVFQSKLKPQVLLKNNSTSTKSNLPVRRVLVVFQFALSIIMVIATIVVYQQLKYVDTADMGFNKEQLLVVDINSGRVRKTAAMIKHAFSQLPAIKSVSVTSSVPGEWKVIPKALIKMQGQQAVRGVEMYYMAVDDQFLKTFEVQLLKGRNFSAANEGDSAAIMLNEVAANRLGITQPSEQLVEIPAVDFNGNSASLQQPFRARIIGIVKDFNFQSMHEQVRPMILASENNPVRPIDYFTVKVATANIAATLKSMEAVLHQVDESHLFEYNFLDKQWALFYREDEKRQVIFLCIALLTILIACLGLFGLATYAAEQRIKEIGIRKVLGAGVGSIVAMLSRDFARLVLIASVVAFPVAGWAMNNWLADYAYRIHIQWWVFVVAGSMALIIALITVSFQTIKAALANPVKNLRRE